MKRAILTTLALCVSLFLGLTAESIAQTAAPASTPTPTPTPPVDVMYTGKLLGYFRVPSLQPLDQPAGCPDRSDADSAAAKAFLDKRKDNKAILVGTGDNFSPQLEARIFSGISPNGTTYPVANKELYFSDGKSWTFYKKLKPNSPLANQIAGGFGTLPTDNVGCFLRAARFAAIVPGKHDFYFGAERVRELARFLRQTKQVRTSSNAGR